MYSNIEFDECKTKVLKYILYKKRTENEVRKKFGGSIEEEILEDLIEYLKENRYIDDEEYIYKCINNFKILKNLSIKEIKYKLLLKGLDINLIENYIYINKDELDEYEIKSAQNIIVKKRRDSELQEIKRYLLKKGYKKENINKALEE